MARSSSISRREQPQASTFSLPHKEQGSSPHLAGSGDNHVDATDSDEEKKLESGKAAPPGPPDGPQPYAHGFWDKEVAKMRKFYLIAITAQTLKITLLIWGIVTIYWGSLYNSSRLSPNINAWIINRDPNGAIGRNVTQAFLSMNSRPAPRLTWNTVDPALYPNAAAIEDAIAVEEKAWVLLEIGTDITAALDRARTTPAGNTFPAGSAISVYYSEARNQQSVDGVILGSVRGALTNIVPMIERQSAAQWLSANAGNAAALTAIAGSPQLIANPLGVQYLNLRPWDQPVAIAPTFVGLIYVMILAFNITIGSSGARQGIGIHKKLRLSSNIMMRILIPIVAYAFISLMFSMINLPFKLSFGRWGYSYGAGFMTWWCFTFVGMCVLGLATEAAVTLFGVANIGFFLVFFIIINVSVANLPIALQVSFFRYGYAMPFYNLRQAYLGIVFNVGRHIDLLKYMGILLAWLVVILLTLPIWIWNERRTEQKAEKGKDDQQGADGAQGDGKPSSP